MTTLLLLLIAIAKAFAAVMAADFLAGLVHWSEDAYGTENTPFVGPSLIRANIVHHHYPRYFTHLTWWQSSRESLVFGVAVIALAQAWGALSWPVVLFAVVSTNANQIHKWSHRTRAENGRVISFFQDIGVIISPRHHALHHTDPKNNFYCPATSLVNPLLEPLRFWDRLEAAIYRVTGKRHRHDTSNRGHGPAPAWLAAYAPAHAARRSAPAPSVSR